jgi:hypothetical protein
VSAVPRFLVFVVVSIISAGPGELLARAFSQEKPPGKPRLHDNWREIEYPAVVVKWNGQEDHVRLKVRNRYEEESDRLKVFLTCSRRPDAKIKLIDPAQINVFLHYAGGKTKVSPDATPFQFWSCIASGLGMSCSLYYDFPWGPNVLEEAWIELRFPEQVYWAEMPYGFTRNPRDKLTPVEVRSGRPVFASAMKKMGEKDLILPWLHVHYDLGRLGINLANPSTAEADVILRGDDVRDLHSPRTAIQIKQPGGWVLRSACRSIRDLDDGSIGRRDSFKFATNPAGDERCWGTAIVKVADKSYEWPVPSSLFKNLHGIADPFHKALVPRND